MSTTGRHSRALVADPRRVRGRSELPRRGGLRNLRFAGSRRPGPSTAAGTEVAKGDSRTPANSGPNKKAVKRRASTNGGLYMEPPRGGARLWRVAGDPTLGYEPFIWRWGTQKAIRPGEVEVSNDVFIIRREAAEAAAAGATPPHAPEQGLRPSRLTLLDASWRNQRRNFAGEA